MPAIIPTPADLQGMPWYARDKAVAHARAAVAALDAAYEPVISRMRLSPEEQARRAATREQDMQQWAEGVRAQARALHAHTPTDPDAAAHRQALLNALMEGSC